MAIDAGAQQRAQAEAVLVASKALVGVAARSLAPVEEEVTLVQFRALLLVVEERATSPGDLATFLDIHPSNATRLVDRLVNKGLLDRESAEQDRRTVVLGATEAGRTLIGDVLEQRRRQIEQILERMGPDAARVAEVLGRFATAAGESGDEAWRLGWVS
ncbi:MAG TPA: MarR family transcriptional regulator [Acidimicrobiales bacterium]